MTDPRIIECAKAGRPLYEDLADADYFVSDENWPLIARAIILKWLEQQPSGEMRTSGANTGAWAEEAFGGFSDCAENVYTAMCAQAAKEIAGE